MNGFCGAVNYEKKEIDFALLRKMSRSVCGINGTAHAVALPGCCAVYCDSRENLEAYPICTSVRGQEYIAVALSDAVDADGEYLAESMLCGYTDEGMSYLERLCGSLCGAVFNRAFGETVLLSDGASARTVYYIIRGKVLYFATELRAILCAVEAFDGCVRADGRALREYLLSPETSSPCQLFCGVECVRSGEGVIFSSFGISSFKTRPDKDRRDGVGGRSVVPCERKKYDARADATRQIRLFGYPRFELPQSLDKRACRAILRSLSAALESALKKEDCVLYKLFAAPLLSELKILKREKNIPARIRLAGMLYQTVKWFESENISL